MLAVTFADLRFRPRQFLIAVVGVGPRARIGSGTERHEELAQIEAGNYVGELGPILNLPRSASVRGLTDSVVIGYTVRAFRQGHPHRAPEQARGGVGRARRALRTAHPVPPRRGRAVALPFWADGGQRRHGCRQ